MLHHDNSRSVGDLADKGGIICKLQDFDGLVFRCAAGGPGVCEEVHLHIESGSFSWEN